MDGILLDTLIQAGALGVVAYIVMQWKREDEQQARQQLESLTNQVTESQHTLAAALDRLATSLDHVEDRLTRLEMLTARGSTTPVPPNPQEVQTHG